MTLPIVKYGDPILEAASQPVTEFRTEELKKLVGNMFETMYAARGIGLAAPQVGVPQQITVIDTSSGEDPEAKLVLINPQIVEQEGSQIGEEGCLSIPGFREDVRRSSKARVKAWDVDGSEFEVTGEELLARALQHEIDHLHGVLFLNHLSALKRDLIRRKIRKLQKAGEWT